MKIISSIIKILFLLSLSQVVSAQKKTASEQKLPLICSDCGQMNAKAINLPVPEYPKAAKAVNASGAVQIQITIDENGNVIEAKPLSGHPLLWASSIKSALQAKFEPVILSGKSIRVMGVIVYYYVTSELTAQSELEKQKEDVPIRDPFHRTVIGKSIKLIKPLFPSTCKCKINRFNQIEIEFTVDENGNVEEAKGISGYPLLKTAGETAIRQSKFSISIVDGSPVKAFGLIIYNFVLVKETWKSRIDNYTLSLEKKQNPINVGIVNKKAKFIPTPVFPKDCRCSGKVFVELIINVASGQVTKAKAISGHTLLRLAAENAARHAIFTPVNDFPNIPIKAFLVFEFKPNGSVEF